MQQLHSQNLRDALHRFSADVRGATAVIFAMLAVPVLGLGLAALDYARAHSTKTEMQTAADNAAIAGAQLLGAPHSEIEDIVRGYMQSNLPNDRRNIDFILTFSPDDTALTLKANTAVSTSILGIVGMTTLPVRVESTVERPAIVPEKIVSPPRDMPETVAQPLPRHLQEVEATARRILERLQRNGSTAEVEQLLRSLGQIR